jgi:hypothetical protein
VAYRSLKEISAFTAEDFLSGSNAVPDCECTVAEIFE